MRRPTKTAKSSASTSGKSESRRSRYDALEKANVRANELIVEPAMRARRTSEQRESEQDSPAPPAPPVVNDRVVEMLRELQTSIKSSRVVIDGDRDMFKSEFAEHVERRLLNEICQILGIDLCASRHQVLDEIRQLRRRVAMIEQVFRELGA